MASAWGVSWGVSWGNSWGAAGAAPAVAVAATGGWWAPYPDSPKKRRKDAEALAAIPKKAAAVIRRIAEDERDEAFERQLAALREALAERHIRYLASYADALRQQIAVEMAMRDEEEVAIALLIM